MTTSCDTDAYIRVPSVLLARTIVFKTTLTHIGKYVVLMRMKAYTLDLRERIVEFVRSGGAKTEAAARFGVSRKTVYRYLAADDSGKLAPKTSWGSRRKRRFLPFPSGALSCWTMRPSTTHPPCKRLWKRPDARCCFCPSIPLTSTPSSTSGRHSKKSVRPGLQDAEDKFLLISNMCLCYC